MTSVTSYFEQGGGLSDTLSHFELRPSQIDLVQAIEAAIAGHNHLIAEAGTGIGKTFSYLLPALLNNQQILISTATKHLQEQIFFKDLPIVETALGKTFSACLLKGRNNYFCHYRYEIFLGSSFQLDKYQAKKVAKLQKWKNETRSGDLAEIAEFVETDYAFKKKITSTTDNCLAGECPYFEDCFVQKVREKAKKSEVVVINHALLMADIVLKETGFAEILPETDIVIIDEAHHLPKIATEAFAEQISANQLIELAKDTLQTYHSDAGDVDGFETNANLFIQAVIDFRTALSDKQSSGQVQLGQLKQLGLPYTAFKTLMQTFKVFLQGVESLAERSTDLGNLSERAQLIAQRIKGVFSPPAVDKEKPSANQSVAILEWGDDYFRAARLPIYLGNRFKDVMETYASSWLFVSATLAIGQSFDFFIQALGLPTTTPTLQVSSPFDYQKQAVIHIFPDLPEPNQPTFVEALVNTSLPILKKTKGRAFMLFTSYKNLYQAADLMQESDFNLFIQGKLPKSQLIDAFMKSDNAVLLGTVSFWEGVDVAGQKLSCVIIDKIPFPSPADPIIAEQSRYLESMGKNAFAHCYIPKAVTLLKQGAGRLIRSNSDIGVLIFADRRILSKSYGKQLIAALPPAKQVEREGLLTFIDDNLS